MGTDRLPEWKSVFAQTDLKTVVPSARIFALSIGSGANAVTMRFAGKWKESINAWKNLLAVEDVKSIG